MNTQKIGFIGGGNMAACLLNGLIASGHPAQQLWVSDTNPETLSQLALAHNVNTSLDNLAIVDAVDVIVLAVKPQILKSVVQTLAAPIHAKKLLVVSIAAGISQASLSAWLGDETAIVRCMPNTPALIGAGVTGLCAHASVDEAGRLQAEQVLSAVGSVRWVDNESLMDAVTAISGSGPAYVFYFIEALQQAGQNLGLDEVTARQLSIETFVGAAKLALQSDENVLTLRERVTSKGGTTAAALQSLEADQVKAAIIRAVEAAQVRGCDLSNQLGQD